jgi:hypothetical protein
MKIHLSEWISAAYSDKNLAQKMLLIYMKENRRMSKNNKNFSDRAKRMPFETEEEFQDNKRPNAKPSEPSRTTQNQAATNRDVKKGGATDTKKV